MLGSWVSGSSFWNLLCPERRAPWGLHMAACTSRWPSAVRGDPGGSGASRTLRTQDAPSHARLAIRTPM